MWSVGCILGELVNGKACFQGKSTLNQIEKVLMILGPPSKEDIQAIDSQYCRDVLNSIHVSKQKALRTFFSRADDQCLDLINKLL